MLSHHGFSEVFTHLSLHDITQVAQINHQTSSFCSTPRFWVFWFHHALGLNVGSCQSKDRLPFRDLMKQIRNSPFHMNELYHVFLTNPKALFRGVENLTNSISHALNLSLSNNIAQSYFLDKVKEIDTFHWSNIRVLYELIRHDQIETLHELRAEVFQPRGNREVIGQSYFLRKITEELSLRSFGVYADIIARFFYPKDNGPSSTAMMTYVAVFAYHNGNITLGKELERIGSLKSCREIVDVLSKIEEGDTTVYGGCGCNKAYWSIIRWYIGSRGKHEALVKFDWNYRTMVCILVMAMTENQTDFIIEMIKSESYQKHDRSTFWDELITAEVLLGSSVTIATLDLVTKHHIKPTSQQIMKMKTMFERECGQRLDIDEWLKSISHD